MHLQHFLNVNLLQRIVILSDTEKTDLFHHGCIKMYGPQQWTDRPCNLFLMTAFHNLHCFSVCFAVELPDEVLLILLFCFHMK